MERIEFTSVIAADSGVVWRFHMDPRNLMRVSPHGTEVRILTPDPVVGLHKRIRVSIRVWSIYPVEMENEIAEFEPERRFVDIQVRGPFEFFRHEHLFEPANGGTRLTDIIMYETPGLLGHLADVTVVRRHFEHMLEHRHISTQQILRAERMRTAAR